MTFTVKNGRKTVTVGRASLSIAAGKSATPKIKLAKPAKTVQRAKRKLALAGKVVVADGAGNQRTFSVKTTLR